MNARFERIERAINSACMSFAPFIGNERAAMSSKAISSLLVSAIMLAYVGYQAIGMLLNTTLMTQNGITGTNQSIMAVIGLLVIVAVLQKFAPK